MAETEKFELYKGDVELTLDKKHIYRAKIKKAEPKIVYGTTSITGVLSKPALMNWAVKLTKDKVIEEALRLGGRAFVEQLQEVVLLAGRQHFIVGKEAMELGTRVHDIAEKWLVKGTDQNALIMKMLKIEDMEERLSCSAMLEFFHTYKLKPIALERRVFSLEHGYAGTADYYGDMNGKITVGDYKTSKAIYEDYPLQVTAYANALEEEGFKVDQTAIIRFGKDGTLEVQTEKDWKKHLPAFLGAKAVYESRMALKGLKYKKVIKK